MIYPPFINLGRIPKFNDDANYTLTLQQLCEVETGLYHQSFDAVADEAIKKLFNFNYEFWSDNPDLKKEFEKEFIRHFYMRELGYETPAYFKLKLQDTFILWMPYYSTLMKAALKAANLDWTITDDYYIDYFHTGASSKNTNDNNKTSNKGQDTRTNEQIASANTNGEESNTGTITDVGKSTNNKTGNNVNSHTGNNTETESGSMNHSYDKAIARTDTPQDRFQQGGRGDEFALDILGVKMDYATEILRENYKGADTAMEKRKTTEFNEQNNQKIDETTTGNNDNTRTLGTKVNREENSSQNINSNETITRGTTTDFEGVKSEKGSDNEHNSTHEAGRRGVPWIDLYQKYLNTIRNVQDDIFNRFDKLLFLQIWW